MNYKYDTTGVCSKQIGLDIQGNIIKKVNFTGGCDGSLKGISLMVTGLTPAEAAKRLSGIKCGSRTTSCPDQLSRALEHWIRANS